MAANPNALHIGKRSDEAKTMVTPAMHDMIDEIARRGRCTPSDVLNDAIYLVLTGKTYSEHVANDRRQALSMEGRQQGDSSAPSPDSSFGQL